jgi:superfamily II DNA/RNA helicase
MGITTPTPIQARTLPPLFEGRDVIGQARTGSGKTLAFGLPLVERVRGGRGAAQALVLTPTRELASQVATVLGQVGRGHRARVVELVGGRSYGPQADALRAGAEIVVGTPGRVLDHLKQGTLRLHRLTYLVLDEADEMLDRGFGPDVERIIGHVPTGPAAPQRQTALFSATVPEWVRQVAAKLLNDPVVVQIDAGKPAGASAETIEHVVYDVPSGAKAAVLRALLDESRDGKQEGATLVFGRTKHGVKKLALQLEREGYKAAALQANLSQNARDRVIADFKKGAIPILVATNVAARGLDVDGLGRVINFDLPENGALFTHRVGRTGRMGRSGQAITLLDPEDQPKWRQLEKELKAAGLKQALPRTPWRGPLPAGMKPVAVTAITPEVVRPVVMRVDEPVREYRPGTRSANGAPRRDGRRWQRRDTRPASPSTSPRGAHQIRNAPRRPDA